MRVGVEPKEAPEALRRPQSRRGGGRGLAARAIRSTARCARRCRHGVPISSAPPYQPRSSANLSTRVGRRPVLPSSRRCSDAAPSPPTAAKQPLLRRVAEVSAPIWRRIPSSPRLAAISSARSSVSTPCTRVFHLRRVDPDVHPRSPRRRRSMATIGPVRCATDVESSTTRRACRPGPSWSGLNSAAPTHRGVCPLDEGAATYRFLIRPSRNGSRTARLADGVGTAESGTGIPGQPRR